MAVGTFHGFFSNFLCFCKLPYFLLRPSDILLLQPPRKSDKYQLCRISLVKLAISFEIAFLKVVHSPQTRDTKKMTLKRAKAALHHIFVCVCRLLQ